MKSKTKTGAGLKSARPTSKPKLPSPKIKKELYFTIKLTANEHFIVEDMIREWAQANHCQVVYYRELKTGHVPMQRECKIKGNIPAFLRFAKENYIYFGNYHRSFKELQRMLKAGMISGEEFVTKTP